ncbi:MAG TPA: enoyl-CoA hydratase/isomerase family protein [Kofleriaceae bacterium]|jgi:enoyl-CoA hydratase/carnithine racemase|nr:enoyl-CoA hydratase/isomerase family protein [Kofleriaceae bacterium]
MTDPAVQFSVSGTIGVLTLNRPDNRNSMTPELLDSFVAASAEARAADLRCLVITGRGTCFSSGADFKATLSRDGDHRAPNERSYAMYEPFLTLLDIPVPVIGALNGHSVGGGFGLALLCDIRIGARDAKYGANFARLGLAPGMAISYLLPRLIGVARASELLFTGRLVDGDEAERLGILSRAIAAGDVLGEALALAQTIADNAPLAVRATKRAIQRGLDLQIRDAARLEAYAQAETLTTQDAREGIAALLAKRPPRFTGS